MPLEDVQQPVLPLASTVTLLLRLLLRYRIGIDRSQSWAREVLAFEYRLVRGRRRGGNGSLPLCHERHGSRRFRATPLELVRMLRIDPFRLRDDFAGDGKNRH